ncbi:L-threonylcarbamoyladenylate synthase [Crocinitomix algicola]|uniref:L-threonylcarbamoyladenylate synthase n=1 Tax=Crocinitomix algicola TaxID=1740263 RepID=UPI00082A57D8|nr:L-threonylcarbamoyladenylate synthase [Crocinitomix algicola]
MKSEVEKAVNVIKNGGVILYPTDTIWGLGCDPTNEDAIQKLLDLKKRAPGKSFILLVHNEALLQRYVKEIPPICYDLIDHSTRPLTIIYPQGQYVSNQVIAPDGSIAIRITQDPFCKELTRVLKHGIVSTSANVSQQPYSNDIRNLPAAIRENVDYIVNLPLKNENAPPSQIIKVGLDGEINIIRK